MKLRHQRGFTLIEIAIALTVISLVLGGALLAGNSMIERSRVAALLSKIKDLGAASRDFKSRYGYFPGDLPVARNFINGLSDECKNNAAGSGVDPNIVGNGLVDSSGESSCALEHLVRAELLTKVEIDSAEKYFIGTAFTDGKISLWYDDTTNENMIQITSVPCKIALELDRRLDNDSANPLSSGNVKTASATQCGVSPAGANDSVTLLVKY